LIYSNNTFENIYIEDVSNIGDMSDASYLNFNSGEEKKLLYFKNITIKNGRSNGPFITLQGYDNIVNFENAIFDNITSYGSIIKFISNKVNKHII